MENMWTLRDPRLVRCWSQWTTLLWKAFLMRKRSIGVSVLEVLVPVIFSIQIRLIFEPLALSLQNIDHHTREEILSLAPPATNYRYAPRNDFTDRLMGSVSTMLRRPVTPAADERELVTTFYGNSSKTDNLVWVVFQVDDAMETQPEVLNYKIRTKAGEEDDETDWELYGGFMAMQMAVESSFIELWRSEVSTSIDKNVTIGRFPYYRIHFPMLPSAVRPNISLIYYMTVVGFILIPVATLHKAIHDKATGFKALMRMLRINVGFMYLGWLDYLMITAISATIATTWILSPIYSNSGPILLGIFFLTYIAVSAAFIFAVGAFFTHATKAVLASSLLWIFLAHLTILLDEQIINSGLLIKSASLLLPHSGLLYGLAALTSRSDIDGFNAEEPRYLESRQNGTEDRDEVTVGLVLLFWTFHLIAWYHAAVYLENVNTGKFGTKKPWYYPCKKKSKPSDVAVTFRGTTDWSAVERAPKFTQAKVRVRRVTMRYGFAERLRVLHDMSIDFYPNEFSVVLGHNGAGKSSLLKVMSGMYKATHGNVYIEGRDYSDEEWYEYQKKSLISYCPQENILVNYLNAGEHVHLFGMMKGMGFAEARRESVKLLRELGLENDKYFMIDQLTFGGKRRLCLAMALIGRSEVLILDEPTYGIDPQHRREIWRLLSTLRGKRTIVMATNSMEAADTLADRIAIIANGRIECCGSKSFLNRRYGIGYELRLIVRPGCDVRSLRDQIQEFSPALVGLRGVTGTVVRFSLPRGTRFPRLLGYLDDHSSELGVRSFVLNPPSIEGQFIKIGLASSFRERGVSFPVDKYELMVQHRRRELINSGNNWVKVSNWQLYLQQIAAMMYKKLLHVASSLNLYIFSVVFSVITLILAITVSELTRHTNFHPLEVDLNASKYASRNFLMLYHVSLDPWAQEFFSSVKSIIKLYGENNYDLSGNFRDRYFMSMDILSESEISIMYSPIAAHSGPIALNLFNNAFLRFSSKNDRLRINLESQPLIDLHYWQNRIVHQRKVKNWENAVIIITLFLVLPTLELGITEARSLTKQLQLNTSGITPLVYWMPIFFIDTVIYIFSIFTILMSTLAMYPNKIDASSATIAQALLILVAYGMAAMSMGYCIQMVVHRRGTVYIVIIAINFVAILAMNPAIMFPVLMKWLSEPLRIFIEVILHGIPSYVLACAIGNYIGINLYNSQCKSDDKCESEFGIEDPCCQNCGDGICHVPLSALLASNSGSVLLHSILTDVLIMLLQAFFFHFVLFIFESKRYKQSRKPDTAKNYSAPLVAKSETEDESPNEVSVNNSTEGSTFYVEEEPGAPEVAVTVQNLSQYHKKKAIVHSINFKINRGECFALLGMNGAGKSTVARILTGQIAINIGRAIIHGVDLSRNPDEFLGMIGYCPQNNGLIEFLTGRQNLRFYAAIRGVPRESIEEEIDKWLDVFELLDFENLKLKNCAWGIKRKICLLQSIIGRPPVLLMDEPASGMDVISRNALVETLYQVKQMGTTLCLTTHSTEEAEAICNNLGLLVGGKLVEAGSPDDVRQSFGDKMMIRVILHRDASDESIEAIKTSIQSEFPSVKFVGEYLRSLNYELQNGLSYAEIYDRLAGIKFECSGIIDFFVNKISLERIFHELSDIHEPLIVEQSVVRRIFQRCMKIFRTTQC